MADISKIKILDGTTYNLKDSVARSMIDVITNTFADALDNHTEGYEGLAFKTVSGSVVTFDTCDLD